MQKYQNSIQNRAGDAIYNALVTVTTLAGVPVVVFSDNGITVQPQVRTDDKGMFAFYVSNGRYNLIVSGTNIVTYTLTDVVIDDSTQSTIVVDTFDTLATVDDIRDLIGVTNNTTVSTLGYWSAGDGGAGTYRFDLSDTTSADNGVTIIVATDGGRWKLVHNGKIYAAQAGAINDGVTATQTYINAAFTAGIKHLVFDAGSYLLAGSITLSGVRQKITSEGSAVFIRGTATGAMVILSGSYCEVNGIEFNGDRTTYPASTSSCIACPGSYNIISNCIVHDSPVHGISMDGQTSALANNNSIITNTIYDCDGIGISQHTAPDNTIADNDIYDCVKEGITIDVTSHRCRAINNRITGCGASGCGGIGIDKTFNTVVSGNYIDMAAIVKPGICCNGTAGVTNNCSFSGNTIIGTDIGILLKRLEVWVSGAGFYESNYNSIIGNTIKDCSEGIKIGKDCNGNVVKGNTFENCALLINVSDTVSTTRIDSGLVSVVARNTVERTDVTGDGTDYVVPFDDLVSGSASDFDVTTGIFTAPIGGLYMFTSSLRVIGGSTHDNAVISLHFSNNPVYVRSAEYATDQTTQNVSISGITRYMRSGDTVEVIVSVAGGTKTVEVQGEGQNCYFMATLLG